jgi:hypothetical protein
LATAATDLTVAAAARLGGSVGAVMVVRGSVAKLVVVAARVGCSRAVVAMVVPVAWRRPRRVLVVRVVPAVIPGCSRCWVGVVSAVMAGTAGLRPALVVREVAAVVRGCWR